MYCKSFLSLPVNCFCPSDSLGFFPFIYLIYNLSMVPTYLSILGDVAPLPSWIYSCVAFCEESIQQFAAPLGIFFSNYSPKLQVNNMDLLVECKWSLYQRISKIPHSDKHYLHQSPFWLYQTMQGLLSMLHLETWKIRIYGCLKDFALQHQCLPCFILGVSFLEGQNNCCSAWNKQSTKFSTF